MRKLLPWLVFLAVPAFAQTEESSAVLTLSQALDLAAQHTEPVAIAQARETQAEHRITRARAAFFPYLAVQGNYQQQDPNGASARINPVFGAPQYYGRLGLTQNVFNGLRDWFTFQNARTERDSADDTRRATEITLYRDAAALFYGVLAAESDLRHLKDALKAGRERTQELSSRVKLGRSRKADWLAALTQLSAIEAQVRLAEQVVRTQRGQLAIRLKTPEDVRLEAPQTDLPAVEPMDVYLARVESRPDVMAQVKLADMSQTAQWIARAGHWPTLSATGNVYFIRGGSQAGNSWDATAQLEFPLFQGGAIVGAAREAAERNKELELALAQTRRLAREEILSAWESTNGTRLQAIALKKAQDDARASFEEQEKNYRYGQAQNLDVITALNAWVDASRNHDRVRFQSWNAFVSLQGAAALLGRPSP